MKYATIQAMIDDRAWEAGKGMSAFDSERNYMGADRSEWVVGFSRTRDTASSCIVTESNFAALLDLLGGESEGVVEVARIGHWACGWVEQIHVSVSATDKLEILREALNAVADYTILDDSAYSDAEQEYKQDAMDSYRSAWTRELAKWLGCDADELETDEGTEAVLWILYDYECGYGGTEQGYLTAECIGQHVPSCNYELTDAARSGNKLARRVLRHAGVKMTPKRA